MTMCVTCTPVEDHTARMGLWVKREDMCCPPGPHFSKCRGVWAHVASRPEGVIGVLDTSHSQGGWAVAQACAALGKKCRVYYPIFKRPRGYSPSQVEAERLGAGVVGLPAGRSAVLYHAARRDLSMLPYPTYMMPNALKLPESVEETALEVRRTFRDQLEPHRVGHVLVSASSGTIAAGVVRGLSQVGWPGTIIVHLGYSRPERAVRQYITKMAHGDSCPEDWGPRLVVVDEGYSYADEARDGQAVPWPCNSHYDLKAARWWLREGRATYGRALMWNVG